MAMPLVSVVTPLYNHRRWLPRTVDAMLGQTLSDWEWIIVDDCSTDGSWEYVQEAAQRDSRIKVLRNEQNLKNVLTTQRGMDAAQGEFLHVLDSDDAFMPSALQNLSGLLRANPAASLAFARCLTMDSQDGCWGGWPRKPSYARAGLEEFHRQFFDYTIRCVTFRMTAVRAIGGRAALPLRRLHDKWFDLRCMLLGDVVYTDDRLGLWRKHDGNHSYDLAHQATPDVAAEAFLMVDDLVRHLPEETPFDRAAFVQAAYKETGFGIARTAADADAAGLHESAAGLRALLRERGLAESAPAASRPLAERMGWVHGLVKRATYRRLPPIRGT